ncbi:MAG: DUF499 domain-containing protein [Candidatus Aenigmatarchaeota archaeon]
MKRLKRYEKDFVRKYWTALHRTAAKDRPALKIRTDEIIDVIKKRNFKTIDENLKYLVNLKWIPPLKSIVYYEKKLAEFIPLITSHEIKKGKNNGKPAVRSRVFLPEFIGS